MLQVEKVGSTLCYLPLPHLRNVTLTSWPHVPARAHTASRTWDSLSGSAKFSAAGARTMLIQTMPQRLLQRPRRRQHRQRQDRQLAPLPRPRKLEHPRKQEQLRARAFSMPCSTIHHQSSRTRTRTRFPIHKIRANSFTYTTLPTRKSIVTSRPHRSSFGSLSSAFKSG